MKLQTRLCGYLPALALLCCVNSADAQIASPSFEVASVKVAPPGSDPMSGHWNFPNVGRFNATHLSLAMLMQLAYDVDDSQIDNKPAWLETELYDIDAKPEDGLKLTREELRPRLQELLRQRFHLAVHTEVRSVRGYALLVSEPGQRLIPTTGEHFAGWRSNTSRGHMRGSNWSMQQLAKYLTPAAGFPVVDQTGLSGSYDIGFDYNPQPEAQSDLSPLDVALKQATGLLLKPQKVSVETIVIDSADKVPTPD